VKPIDDMAAVEFKHRNPGVEFIIGAVGSGQGISLAGQCTVDIVMASRVLDPKEKAAFADLAEYKIGVDALVMVSNISNAVSDYDRSNPIHLPEIDSVSYRNQVQPWRRRQIDQDHSARIAIIGSILAARRAGK
jgi:hypothetical protein